MANAYKCDRCGRYYEGRSSIKNYVIQDFRNRDGDMCHAVDLCPECRDRMNEIIDKFLDQGVDWIKVSDNPDAVSPV